MPFDRTLALKAWGRWMDLLDRKKFHRKKSMMTKFINVRGGPTTIRRMYFRDWVKFVFQKRMENKMHRIRDKIANRAENRKTQPKTGYTVSQLVDSIEVMKMTEVSIRSIKEMGSFTDEDQAKIDKGEKANFDMKEKIVSHLNNLPNPLVPTADQEEVIADYFETLITETDIRPGNLDLARVLLKYVALDFGTLTEDRGLMAVAACDGSIGYLTEMLQHKETRCDTVEVVSSCMFNQEFRIPLTALCLRFADKLQLSEFMDDLVDAWTEFFADIASKKRAIAREDRKERMTLLRAMAHYDGIPIDMDVEGPDCQTVLSRAAHEGDAELVKMLLDLPNANANRVQSDNTTALIQAVFSGNVATVKAVLLFPGVDTTHKSDDGTALALAQSLQRDPEIIKMLKAGGADANEVSHLSKAPTFPPQQLKKELASARRSSKQPTPPTSSQAKGARPAQGTGKSAPAAPKPTPKKEAPKKPEAKKSAPKSTKPPPSVAPSPPTKPPTKPPKNVGKEPPLSPQQKALQQNETVCKKVWSLWMDRVMEARQARRKQMIRKVINVRGSSDTIQRMVFRDWINFVFQKRMENKMISIREKINERNKARGGKQSPKAGTYTITKLCDTVEAMKLTAISIRSVKEMGSFTDEDSKRIEDGEKSILDMKEKAVKSLNNLTAPLQPTSDQSEALEDYFETLITDTDIQPGNLEFAKALLNHVKLDYGTLCEDRGLLAVAACDGSLGYLKALLECKTSRCDTVEVVSSCMFNQEFRIPLTALCLRFADKLQLSEFMDDLVDAWTEFFADIASKKRAIAREDRKERMTLLRAMAHYDGIPIDMDVEGPDCQTVLSRAAHEGDAELVKMILGVSNVDVNRVQSDNTTALIQAVFSGNVAAVKEILAVPGVDLTHKSDDGNALALAEGLQRDPEIIKMLKAGGASSDRKTSLSKAPTFAPASLKKEVAKHKEEQKKEETPKNKKEEQKKPAPSKKEPASPPSHKKEPAQLPGHTPGIKGGKHQVDVAPMKANKMTDAARQDLLKKEINPALLGKMQMKPPKHLPKAK